ncbi:2086_t:CDS:2, partial [Gigaspora rosea]
YFTSIFACFLASFGWVSLLGIALILLELGFQFLLVFCHTVSFWFRVVFLLTPWTVLVLLLGIALILLELGFRFSLVSWLTISFWFSVTPWTVLGFCFLESGTCPLGIRFPVF